MTLRLTKRAIRVLTARYRAVLLAAIMGTMATTGAMAADTVDVVTSVGTTPVLNIAKTDGSTITGMTSVDSVNNTATTKTSLYTTDKIDALLGDKADETKLGAGASGYDINAKSLQVQGKDVLTTDSSIAATKVTEDDDHKFVTAAEKTQIGTNTTNISANTSAITKLNGDASTAGSVANTVNAAITALNLPNTYEAKGAAAAVQGATTETVESVDAKVATLNGDASTTGSVANTVNAAITALDLPNTYDAKGAADTALATANTNIDNAIKYDSTAGIITFKNSDGSTDSTAYSKDKADTTFAGLAANNTFSGNNTFNGKITSTGDISTTGDISAADGTFSGTLNVTGTSTLGAVNAQAISGTTGTFSGALTSVGLNAGAGAIQTTGTLAAGASTLDSLTVTNNATVGGTLAVTGALSSNGLNAGSGAITTTGAISGATGTFTGALKSEGLDAGSGLIKTTGALQAGAATVSSLDAGSGLIKTTGAVEAGTLAVSGTSTFTGLATFGTAGFNLGGNTVTGIETAAVAAGAGKTDTLATTATVLASAENGAYSGTKVKGDTASATLGTALDKGLTALNNVLIADGSKVDDAKVEVSWNSTNSTLETVLGNGVYSSTNQLTAGASVTTALSALDTAVGNTTFSGKNAAGAADLTVAVNSLDTAIGDRSTLSATNGNLTAGSDIVTALNALDGTLGNVKALDGTTGAQTGNLAAAGSTVADHLTAIDNRLGQIHGLVANATDTTTTTGKAYAGNLAVGTTVEEHLEALDASIGDRRNYTNPHNIANGQTVAASLNALDTVIGDFGGVTNANGNIGADIATSLDNMDAAIGTRNYTSTKYVTAGDDLTTAVSSLDENLERVENRVNGLEDRTQKMNREMKAGFASLAAMSALVPNARSAGDTQVSLGTGYYRGTAGFALGAFHHFNDNVMMNVGAGYSAHGAGTFRAGVTFGF